MSSFLNVYIQLKSIRRKNCEISSLTHLLFLTQKDQQERKQIPYGDLKWKWFTSFLNAELLGTPHTIFLS